MSSQPPSASAAQGSAEPATWAAASMPARPAAVVVAGLGPHRLEQGPGTHDPLQPRPLVAELAGDLAPPAALGADQGVAPHEHLVEEHLVEVVGPRHVMDGADRDALRPQR